MGFFGTLFGGEAEENAANANKQLAAKYGLDANSFLKTGYDTGQTNIDKSIGAYQPLSELGAKYNAGGDLYRDSLGINGPEGNARAAGAFQNNPGYTGAVTAGLDAINRRRAIGGMSNSGNADIDALTFGQNLQNQQFGNWQQNLERTGQTGIGLIGSAVAGEAGGYNNLASLAGQYAQNQTGVAGNVLGADTSANTLEAQGKAAGAKNLLGAGMSLATLAMGGMGGGGLSSLAGAANSGASSLFGSAMGQPWQQANTGRWGSSFQGPVAG